MLSKSRRSNPFIPLECHVPLSNRGVYYSKVAVHFSSSLITSCSSPRTVTIWDTTLRLHDLDSPSLPEKEKNQDGGRAWGAFAFEFNLRQEVCELGVKIISLKLS